MLAATRSMVSLRSFSVRDHAASEPIFAGGPSGSGPMCRWVDEWVERPGSRCCVSAVFSVDSFTTWDRRAYAAIRVQTRIGSCSAQSARPGEALVVVTQWMNIKETMFSQDRSQSSQVSASSYIGVQAAAPKP